MPHALTLAEEKKLSVTYRIEPGCLGPDGKDHIDNFCDQAQENIRSGDSDYIVWHIIPRYDKSLPEMQYSVLGKKVNHVQADKYLSVFGKSLDELEGSLVDQIADLIGQFSKS